MPRAPLLYLLLAHCVIGLAGAQAPDGASGPAAVTRRATWSVSPWSGVGTGPRLVALGRPVTGTPWLLGADVAYARTLGRRWGLRLSAGGMHVRRAGRVGEDGYRASAWRLALTPEVTLRPSTSWQFGVGVEVRTAADLEAFELRAGRNVRPHARLEVSHPLSPRLAAAAVASALLSRRRGAVPDVTAFLDPGRSLRLGIRYSPRPTR